MFLIIEYGIWEFRVTVFMFILGSEMGKKKKREKGGGLPVPNKQLSKSGFIILLYFFLRLITRASSRSRTVEASSSGGQLECRLGLLFNIRTQLIFLHLDCLGWYCDKKSPFNMDGAPGSPVKHSRARKIDAVIGY